jgi:hypothetical protein
VLTRIKGQGRMEKRAKWLKPAAERSAFYAAKWRMRDARISSALFSLQAHQHE